jgi:hypothetical protein
VCQVGALVGTWVAGSLALVLLIRLIFRAVRAARRRREKPLRGR